MTRNMSDKTGGWFDDPRRTYNYEQRAALQCFIDSIQCERHFAKPTDVRANPASAFAPGKLGWRLMEICVLKWQAVARIAAVLEKLAMHVDDASCTCLLVQVVHILGTKEQALPQGSCKVRERKVRWVGFGR
jgi:hypothetical protein